MIDLNELDSLELLQVCIDDIVAKSDKAIHIKNKSNAQGIMDCISILGNYEDKLVFKRNKEDELKVIQNSIVLLSRYNPDPNKSYYDALQYGIDILGKEQEKIMNVI